MVVRLTRTSWRITHYESTNTKRYSPIYDR